MDLQSRLEKEIEAIENDDSLTNAEKQREIRELERDAYNYARDEAEERYRDTMNNFGYEWDGY
jgi:DNA-binding protein YbaB